MKEVYVSIVVPAYNEALSLPSTIKNLYTELKKITPVFEILIVNDGSTDNTNETVKQIISALKDRERRIKYIPLTRNFGKEAAVLAGYERANGELVGSIDADGQHPVKSLGVMIKELITDKDIDVIIGVRSDQTHKSIGFSSSIFYKLTQWFGNKHLIPNGTDFRVLRRQVLKDYLKLREHDRINRDLMDWLGYPYKIHEFKAAQRIAGKPTYNFAKLLKLATDGIISSGTRPLALLLPLGVLITCISILALSFIVINALLLDDHLHLGITWQGVALTVIIFFFGLTLSALGVIAAYPSRTFNEVRNRPLYVVNERAVIE